MRTQTTAHRHPEANRSRLSDEQLAEYRTEGFTIFREPVLKPEAFAGLREHFEQKLARWPADERPEGMDVPHFADPALFDWVLSDDILDLVEPILGPNIALFSTHFICKPTGDGRRVPWHEDSAYWKTMLEPMEVCTVWLAIDPSTRVNGCMKVIPRTHGGGFSDYDPVDTSKNVFPTEITASQRDDARAVDIELEANQASLHDARLMHGSDPNTSDIRRCGYTMRFISSATRLTDKARQEYADPNKSYADLIEARAARGKKGH
jgi:chlorinating enzyme